MKCQKWWRNPSWMSIAASSQRNYTLQTRCFMQQGGRPQMKLSLQKSVQFFFTLSYIMKTVDNKECRYNQSHFHFLPWCNGQQINNLTQKTHRFISQIVTVSSRKIVVFKNQTNKNKTKKSNKYNLFSQHLFPKPKWKNSNFHFLILCSNEKRRVMSISCFIQFWFYVHLYHRGHSYTQAASLWRWYAALLYACLPIVVTEQHYRTEISW